FSLLKILLPLLATLFPYTTLCRSLVSVLFVAASLLSSGIFASVWRRNLATSTAISCPTGGPDTPMITRGPFAGCTWAAARAEKRSEEQRLNSSHVAISYAVFCL